jgi:hypothetical protein
VETLERPIAEQIMLIAAFLFCMILLGCGEWENAEVGRVSCSFGSFGSFSDFYRPVKIASGNDGNNLYILDNYSVHSYRRDNLYECAFDWENTYTFNGFPNDVLFAGSNFYVQDRAQLKFTDNTEACSAKDGVFAIYGNELAIGSNAGIEIWDINSCVKKANISSQKVLALAATNSEYYVAEGIATEPQHLAMFPKNSSLVYREPMSSIPGNEKNFCSADRVIANNYGVYLLDKKCRKIGVFDNQAVWRKSMNLDSMGVRNVLDIAPGEYSHIFILHERGVEKVNVF